MCEQSSKGIVHMLTMGVGISAWMGISALWAELPVLVRELPEGWTLSTYVVVVNQMANIGPITYSLARRYFKPRDIKVPVIHFIIWFSILSWLCMGFFWEEAAMIGGTDPHSIAFIILCFPISLLDCTSSVMYMPFMANYKEIYMIPYMIGESMSVSLPSIVALIQGAGGSPECRNITYNSTRYEYHSPPRFSVSIYTYIISAMICLSWVAFVLLNNLPISKKERVSLTTTNTTDPVKTVSSGMECILSQQEALLTKTGNTRRFATLLAIEAYVSFFYLVVLPIQTFSCLPYGIVTYHLAVNLAGLTQPFLSLLALVLAANSLISLFSICFIASLCGSYLYYAASMSPSPPLVDSPFGAAIVVITWVFVLGCTFYVRTCVAIILRHDRGHASGLFWCGVVTQIGLSCGAILNFFMVNYTGLFHSYSPCEPSLK